LIVVGFIIERDTHANQSYSGGWEAFHYLLEQPTTAKKAMWSLDVVESVHADLNELAIENKLTNNPDINRPASLFPHVLIAPDKITTNIQRVTSSDA